MTAVNNYYYGHGQAWLGVRNSSGVVTNFDINLPEMDELTISLATEKVEHISKRNSIASKDLSVVKSMSCTGKMMISSHSADLLKVYLFGTKSAVTGGSFTAIAFPTGITANQTLPIGGGRKNISSLVITDSAGSPATLVLGTDYTVDLQAGLVTFLSTLPGTQPYKAAGTEAPATAVGIFTGRVFERWLRFSGINIASDDQACVVDLYKIQIEPAKAWNLLNNSNAPNQYELDFEMLRDTTVASSATLGQFGEYREI